MISINTTSKADVWRLATCVPAVRKPQSGPCPLSFEIDYNVLTRYFAGSIRVITHILCVITLFLRTHPCVENVLGRVSTVRDSEINLKAISNAIAFIAPGLNICAAQTPIDFPANRYSIQDDYGWAATRPSKSRSNTMSRVSEDVWCAPSLRVTGGEDLCTVSMSSMFEIKTPSHFQVDHST
jgi:hypothetical protein